MATPVLSYGFGIIDWPQIEIDELDVKTRKILSIHKVLYRNQCMERVYLPRREGGMGLIEINDTYRNTILNLDYYLKTIQDGYLLKVKKQVCLETSLSLSWQTSSSHPMNRLIKQVTMRIQHKMPLKHI